MSITMRIPHDLLRRYVMVIKSAEKARHQELASICTTTSEQLRDLYELILETMQTSMADREFELELAYLIKEDFGYQSEDI